MNREVLEYVNGSATDPEQDLLEFSWLESIPLVVSFEVSMNLCGP
jgi:hypothetical protein